MAAGRGIVERLVGWGGEVTAHWRTGVRHPATPRQVEPSFQGCQTPTPWVSDAYAVADGGKNSTTKPPHAKRHCHDARHRVSHRRPPARPNGDGQRKLLQNQAAVEKHLKYSTRPSAHQAQATRARCGVGLGCAGRVDAPEGIRRQPPQAATRMTTGQSGAKAPDRNRSPARPRPTTHRASKELFPPPAATAPPAPRPPATGPRPPPSAFKRKSHSNPATS